ncbi:MAG: GHKL domain-containing protein [Lachnospiraceae bacterium]|nr:GHKL domain-containing protein [Lachnospiraceae bacterium]
MKKLSIQYHILTSFIIIIDCLCITLLGDFVTNELVAERKWIIELAYIFTVLGVFVQLGLLVAMILSRDEHKEKEALNAKYLEEQVSHYEYLENREQETRKFRHDMNNHLTILRSLYDAGKTDEFEEYFDTISNRITSFGNQISVGNNTADAIINQYAGEAERTGITLNVEGHFPPECHIAAVDICTIFSNLLSNAIRAEREAGGNQVKLVIRSLDDEVFVEVANDYATEVKRSGNCFISTKEDRANHGLGLQNVYDCVERNHGVIHITTDNRLFDVKLNLKNTEA